MRFQKSSDGYRKELAAFVCIVGLSGILTGCAAKVAYPETRLQRVVLPGLGNLKDEDIRAEFKEKIEATSPASAGVAWLSEEPGGMSGRTETPVSEYQRTGILDATIKALQHAPFASVSVLPTVSSALGGEHPSDVVRELRSEAARFQEDVAILMQTGVSQSRGLNIFAVGFIGLVTAPFFPGVDLATGASAELCAVDVRTGLMIACARGRGEARRRFLFLTQESRAGEQMKEETLTEATVAAAQNLRVAVAKRLATP